MQYLSGHYQALQCHKSVPVFVPSCVRLRIKKSVLQILPLIKLSGFVVNIKLRAFNYYISHFFGVGGGRSSIR